VTKFGSAAFAPRNFAGEHLCRQCTFEVSELPRAPLVFFALSASFVGLTAPGRDALAAAGETDSASTMNALAVTSSPAAHHDPPSHTTRPPHAPPLLHRDKPPRKRYRRLPPST